MSMSYLTTMRDAAINAVRNGQENLVLPKNISRQTCEMFVRSLNCELEPQFGASLELEEESPDPDKKKMWMSYLHKSMPLVTYCPTTTEVNLSNHGLIKECRSRSNSWGSATSPPLVLGMRPASTI